MLCFLLSRILEARRLQPSSLKFLCTNTCSMGKQVITTSGYLSWCYIFSLISNMMMRTAPGFVRRRQQQPLETSALLLDDAGDSQRITADIPATSGAASSAAIVNNRCQSAGSGRRREGEGAGDSRRPERRRRLIRLHINTPAINSRPDPCCWRSSLPPPESESRAANVSHSRRPSEPPVSGSGRRRRIVLSDPAAVWKASPAAGLRRIRCRNGRSNDHRGSGTPIAVTTPAQPQPQRHSYNHTGPAAAAAALL